MNKYFPEITFKKSAALLFAIVVAIAGAVACGGSSDGGTAGGGGGMTGGSGGMAGGGGVGATAGMAGAAGVAGTTGGVGGGTAGQAGSVAGGGGEVAGTSGAGTTGGDGGAGTTGGTGGMICSNAPPLPDGACKPNAAGTYASKIIADVYWIPSADLLLFSSTDAGRGQIEVYVKVVSPGVCDNGEAQSQIYPCGIKMPPLTSMLMCSWLNPVVPDAVWDSPTVAPVTVTATTTSFDPGGFLSIPLQTYLYGIDLNDPDATWPTAAETATLACPAGSGVACFPDYDGDGNPAISATFANLGSQAESTGCGLAGTDPFTWAAAPLSADPTVLFPGSNVAKAETLFVGTRFRGDGGGTIGDDCASGWGKASVENFDLRLWSCIRAEGSGTPAATAGQECTVAESDFMDSHLPLYIPLNEGDAPPDTYNGVAVTWPTFVDRSVSKGAVSYVKRVAGPGIDVSCADIRAEADATEAALRSAAGF